MFRNPATFSFTDLSNPAISKGGWFAISNQTLNALAGNDRITGRGGIVGMQIEAKHDTGTGDDLITGSGGRSGIQNDRLIGTGQSAMPSSMPYRAAAAVWIPPPSGQKAARSRSIGVAALTEVSERN
ncbi:MAG: hypothetical protein VKM34_05020 [Cyanobacteriota bacterium]|nr:hypothetical protein [Cyanobacteriota bacterium]